MLGARAVVWAGSAVSECGLGGASVDAGLQVDMGGSRLRLEVGEACTWSTRILGS